DLQARIARCQNADHAARAQGMPAMFEHAAAAASGKGRASRQCRQLTGITVGNLPRAFAVGELVPFPNRIGGHQAAKSEKSKRALTLQRNLSPLSSSSAKPAGAVSRRASRKWEPLVPSPSPSTAATFDQSS